MKEPLIISFSGGRTSAYMAYRILNNPEMMAIYEPFLLFANTGCEHEKTLEFIHSFEINFNVSVVWLEAVVNPEKGAGTRHKVVDFQTAARNGEPYAEVIKKYTKPSVAFPHCTRELKLAPINSWLRDKFWTVNVTTAIGIRADEMRRVKDGGKVIYPLVDRWPTDKSDVLDFWESQAFDLGIPEHLGNCVWCFKKSDKKLLKAMQDAPSYFEFPILMEKLYPNGRNGEPVHFFRKNRSVKDLRNMGGVIGDVHDRYIHDGGCSESCEFLGILQYE